MIRSSSHLSAVSHPSVSVFRRFCGTKTPGWQNSVFWGQNQQRTHDKVGTARSPKSIHTTIYAEGGCLYTHRTANHHHTECAGLPWWPFGSRRARIGCRGSPIRFVPSVWYKRQKLLKFEHVHAKLTMTLDAPPGAAVMGAWERLSQAPITAAPGGTSSVIVNLAWTCSKNSRLGTKRMGRPSADDPCTPRVERPPRQPRTLSVTVVGCSMGIWARTLRVDRSMDGFRGPSDAHFVVCSLLVLGPKYQILSSRRFCATETLEKRNAWMINGRETAG